MEKQVKNHIQNLEYKLILIYNYEKDINGVLMQFSKNYSPDKVKIKIILTKC